LYTKSLTFYDAIYGAMGKDYARESERILEIAREYKLSPGDRLLDVACGTGLHLSYLKEKYQVEGLDLEVGMLEIARRRNPDVVFYQADMEDFDLGQQYDVVLCLFSAIGYARTLDGLRRAIGSMARHLVPGGVLIVEPWILPEAYQPGTVHALYVDEPDLKIARINTSDLQGRISVMEMHYLVGTPDGVEYFTERHELGLFQLAEYQAAFEENRLTWDRDEEGLIGRGLLIGVRQSG
jgi:SAM-dependent methyltransferase